MFIKIIETEDIVFFRTQFRARITRNIVDYWPEWKLVYESETSSKGKQKLLGGRKLAPLDTLVFSISVQHSSYSSTENRRILEIERENEWKRMERKEEERRI